MEFADVIRRRRMIRAFTTEPLAEGTADRLLQAAIRAPSAGFSQGFSFLALEGAEQCAPFWRLIFEQAEHAGDAGMHRTVEAMSQAPLVIVPMASKDVYLNRYAEPDKGWTDRDEARWPVPYWYIDTGFAALLVLLAAVDSGLGAVFFGPPEFADFRAEFGVPEEWTPIGAIAVGHFDPAANPVRPVFARHRKPFADLVHRGRW
jgi:nitroreductase